MIPFVPLVITGVGALIGVGYSLFVKEGNDGETVATRSANRVVQTATQPAIVGYGMGGASGALVLTLLEEFKNNSFLKNALSETSVMLLSAFQRLIIPLLIAKFIGKRAGLIAGLIINFVLSYSEISKYSSYLQGDYYFYQTFAEFKNRFVFAFSLVLIVFLLFSKDLLKSSNTASEGLLNLTLISLPLILVLMFYLGFSYKEKKDNNILLSLDKIVVHRKKKAFLKELNTSIEKLNEDDKILKWIAAQKLKGETIAFVLDNFSKDDLQRKIAGTDLMQKAVLHNNVELVKYLRQKRKCTMEKIIYRFSWLSPPKSLSLIELASYKGFNDIVQVLN